MSDEFVAGASVLHYKIMEAIGHGGMGDVYKARDMKLGRTVVLKTLSQDVRLDPTSRERFLLEATAASQLNHPNIVTIYAIEQVNEIDFIVMEYVEGRILKDLIKEGQLQVSEILDAGIQVARGLSAAHGLGVVHRDIKPTNLILTYNGVLKILDFGLAKRFQTGVGKSVLAITVPEELTASGMLMGTVFYMSPEQVRGEPLDGRSDLFSLGCVLYEAATGRLPFQGANAMSTLMSILNTDPLPASTFRSDLPESFDAVLHRALAKDRNQRFQSAAEFEEALKNLRHAGTADTVAYSVPTDFRTPATHYTRSGDVNIAYQVVGEGPPDIVFVMGWVSHLEYFWNEPSFARFLKRIASFSRLILFDKRGTGMSDRVTHYPTLEQRMDDVRAVMDAVGSEKAALFGVSEGGPMAALFSATYPKRTLGLVMFATYAKRKWDPEYPWGPTEDQRESFFREIEENWGSPVGIETRAPTRMNDPAFRQWWASYLRMGASPGAAVMLTRMNAEVDVRSILPTVRVPTLILHRVGDQCIKVGESRYITSQIPGARMVELPGEDHLPFVGDQDAVLREIEIFVNGIPFHSEIDGVLTTILCLQLTGFDARSTTSAQMKLEQYRQFVRTDVHKFRGRIMVSQEDRILATFDGPARAIRAAMSVREECLKSGIQMKAGIHIGECETIGNRIAGPALTIGTGLAEVADTGEIMVSSMVKDLVPGAGIDFEDRGAGRLPRSTGEWQLFSVV